MILHTQSGRRQAKIFEFQTKGLLQFFYCGVYQFTLQYDVLRWCTVYNHGYSSS
jgi:hypothetical protein